MQADIENTSGQGRLATVPAEINHWNWGAFLLNWIWGLGNNTLIGLLMFVPLVNFVMPFVLGARGSAWAWQNKRWNSIEHFKSAQRLWAVCGAVFAAICVAFVLMFAAVFFGVVTLLKSSDVYALGVSTVQASTAAAAELGLPISTGVPTGSIETSGTRGKADITFSVQGPKGSGTVYLDAVRDLGQWKVNRMVLEIEGSGRRIDLIKPLSDTRFRRVESPLPTVPARAET